MKTTKLMARIKDIRPGTDMIFIAHETADVYLMVTC